MKKQFLQFLIALLPVCAMAQIFVPDDNFEQAIIDLGYDSGPLDNFVPFANIANITSLDVSSKGISDLTGINGFPSLQTLYCNDNQLSTINLSNNAQLRDLRLNDNNLLFINLSNLTQLEVFSANNNQLSSLNVASNPALQGLSVSQNNLTTLDTSSNPFLIQIVCDRNQLTSLTVDTFSDLRELYCYDNQLTSLDVTTNFNLEILWCRSNQLTTLNTTGITSLKTFVAYNNQLTAVDVSTNTALEVLSLGDNNLSAINVSNNPLLTELYLSENQLTAVDVSSNALLEIFWCNENQISTINTFNLTNLRTYVAFNNQLNAVDVSNNGALDLLSIGFNNITTVDVSNNTLLTELYTQANQISSLDVSVNTALEALWCFDNQLTTLDVSSNPNLMSLDIGINNYTALDLSANPQLTQVAVTLCPNLTEFNMKNGNNTIITDFIVRDNPNLTCIEVDNPAYSNANWSATVDAQSDFSQNCFYGFTYVPDDAFEQALINLGYDTAPLDDFVPTNNINTVTNLDISNLGIVDMTGIEAFVALEDLNCSENAIENLDISANTVLTNLNVSNNMISELDFSMNLALEVINVNSNALNSVDLNDHAQLTSFDGANNDFVVLFIKNGNNTNMTSFSAVNNPSLTCIEVDDVAYSTTNWTNIDTQTSFNTDCDQFYTYVPDDNFEQALIDLGYDSGALNNYVLTANINAVTSLTINNKGIADLTGIHDFTALETLNCRSNALTSLDIRPNANLEVLNCAFNAISSIDVTNNYALQRITLWDNDLTELNVSNNSALEYLDVDENNITTLDVSQNLQLYRIWCSQNNLESLNVKNGNNTNFTTFVANNNPNLTCVEVDNAEYSTTNWISIDTQTSFNENCNYGLTYVPDTNFEQALINLGYDTSIDNYVSTVIIEVITTLDVSGLGIMDLTGIEDFTALQELNCSSNTLSTLDITNNVNLTNLNCATNTLTSLNVLNNSLLESLNIDSNNITVLNVNFHPELNQLFAQNNALEILNVQNGNNTNFTAFTATGNPLLTCVQVDNPVWSSINWTSIDVQTSFNQDCGYATYVPDDNFEQALIDIGYDSGPLDDFVPTANINPGTPINLSISNKGISDLTGIEAFSTLVTLDCSSNTISNLNVRANTMLTLLRCESNEMTSLDVDGANNLQQLFCSDNKLQNLDVSNNTELIELEADLNDLETIDLSANTKLVEVDISQNRLTTINVSANTLLEELQGFSNQLTAVNINSLQALRILSFSNNRLRSIDVSNNLNLVDVTLVENFLSDLDVSPNVNLEALRVSDNLLTSLDLNNNPLLTNLQFDNNFVTEMSFEENLNLVILSCSGNRLETIDVSMHTNLVTFRALSNELLHTLNVQNGNNSNVNNFHISSNPNLYCVLVDDAAYSTATWDSSSVFWASVDSQTNFNETSCDYIELSAKVLLQGASLNPNTGEESLMRDDLRSNGLISATSPYGDNATASTIVRTNDNAGNSMVDWVWVELREINNPTNVVAAQSAILQRDGDIVATDDDLTTPLIFNGLPVAKYHVAVKHRNHLGVMTASSETLKQVTTIVDFTNATNQITFGNNAQTTFGIQANTVAMWAGNVNGDTIVQYSGTNPDTPTILSTVLNDPGNFLNFPTYAVSAYITDDLNMDGSTQYSGTNPDTPVILQNVLAHPGNFLNFSTFQIIEQLPENGM
ncbi:hypothetical protein [Kordia sp.]|uniref:leucine-rich repeat domain-containing protein n=1 Tax=Kordia sp. TaxID=1965332 RepID=UPI003D6AEEBE